MGLVWIYAGCMLFTGAINTISTKYQDLTVERFKPDGTPVYFQHPAFQSAMMFSGEALCLIPYFLLRWRRRAIKAQLGTLNTKPPMPRSFVLKRVAAFAIPTLCDATATTLLNIGLFYTFASTYQMLRGTLVLFAGCLTVLILRRRLYLHHWLGMVLIAAGAAIVGFASVIQSHHHHHHHHHHLSPPAVPFPTLAPSLGHEQGLLLQGAGGGGGWAGPGVEVGAGRHLLGTHSLVQGFHTVGKGGSSSSSSSSGGDDGSGSGGSVDGSSNRSDRGELLHGGGAVIPILGDLLVVLAQLFAAMQFVVEEKFMTKFRMQPLLAVGVEGAWGVVLSLCALPLLGHIQAPNGLPLEDARAALEAMARLPDLRNAVILGVVSIGAFNWFGLSVTQALSGASRATIDVCRTLLVWFFSLAAGWETFHELQVLGFIVLISGTSLYNELLRSCLPPAMTPGDLEQGEGFDGDDEGGGVYAALESGPEEAGGAAKLGATLDARQQQLGTAHEPALLRQGALPGQGISRGRAQPGGQPTHSQDIQAARARHHHHHHHHRNFLARSIRLGFNVLSPHSLGEDPEGDSSSEEEEEEGGAGGHGQPHPRGGQRKGVLNPMDLASTPFPNAPTLLHYQRSRSGVRANLSMPQQQQQQLWPQVAGGHQVFLAANSEVKEEGKEGGGSGSGSESGSGSSSSVSDEGRH